MPSRFEKLNDERDDRNRKLLHIGPVTIRITKSNSRGPYFAIAVYKRGIFEHESGGPISES